MTSNYFRQTEIYFDITITKSSALESLFIVAPLVNGWSLFCNAVLRVIPSFVIISLRKREMVALLYEMGLDVTKPVFGVSDIVRLKQVSSATETRWKIEISLEASLDMILSNQRITKALIRLCGCAGWSAPLLITNHQRQVFSRRGPNHVQTVVWLLVFCVSSS